jgi:hypothetical protein
MDALKTCGCMRLLASTALFLLMKGNPVQPTWPSFLPACLHACVAGHYLMAGWAL